MRKYFAVSAATLVGFVAGQSAVTVTAPAPSAPSPAQPPFSITIVSAGQPESASVSSLTVFASPNPAPSPSSQASIAVTTVTAGASSAASPSSSSSGSGGGPGGGSGGGSTPGAGICGLGYTYCGYILKNHQGFADSDVVKAYCAGSAENCANGTPKTDPMNALFICLPPTSQRMGVVLPRQGPQPSSGSTGSGGAGAAPPNGCSSTPGPGNKLQLLCSCGGQCLNPDADHIGRCDKPCA